MLEDKLVKSLKSVARRGGTISAAALSALALVACSAGHITQTSSQVAAVDGAAAGDQATGVTVLDVSVVLDENTGDAALKFTATNQDPVATDYTLESVEVDGQAVRINGTQTIKPGCSLVADSAQGIKDMPEDKDNCIQYVSTSLNNEDFAFGGALPVSFTFDNLDAPLEVKAPVVAPGLPAGENSTDYSGGHSEAAH